MAGVPYQLVQPVGSCQAGTVWSAVDGQGRSLQVAVLDTGYAGVPEWRAAFTTAASVLGQQRAGDVESDLADPAPWVACPSDGGPGAEQVFRGMGLDYAPMPGAAGPAAQGPDAMTAWPAAPTDWPAAPWEEPAPVAGGTAAEPVSGSPAPSWTAEPSWDAASGAGLDQPVGRRIEPVPPPPRRTGLWIAVAALVVVLLAGGATVFFWKGHGVHPAARASSPASVAASTPAAAVAAPSTGPPQHPGLEPPKAGTWPAKWPKFHEEDPVRTYANLDGLDFMVKVPLTWQCLPGGQASGYTRYLCGTPAGTGAQTGGEIIVRTCPAPCDVNRRIAMRKGEEAWGLQWLLGSHYAAYAESPSVTVDGQKRYGLVVVGYYRGAVDGEINRQIVIRMTGAAADAGQIRAVVDFLRDELIL